MRLNQIIHELHRKYDRTFIFVEVEGREVLAHVDNLAVIGEGDKAYGEIQLNTASYGLLKYKIPTANQLIFRLPKTRTYQFGDKACLVTRVPARQWARGMTTSNSAIQDLSRFVAVGGIWSASSLVPYTLASVQAAFTGETYSPEQAVEMLSTGKYSSVAIHGNWAMALSPTARADGYVLLYKSVIVGRVSQRGELLRLANNLYEQPARQLLGGMQ